MKKRKIKKAMKGNTVWCTHETYAPGILPCGDLNCPFKNDEGRLGKASELKACNSFQITLPHDKFERATSVLVAKQHRDKSEASPTLATAEAVPAASVRRGRGHRRST